MPESLSPHSADDSAHGSASRLAEADPGQSWQGMLDRCPDTVVLVSADGTIRHANAAAERLLGYSAADVAGRRTLDFVHAEDSERVCAQFRELLRGPATEAVIIFRAPHRDGSWRWLEAVVSNLSNHPTAFASVRDVTGRHDREEQLRRRADELEEADRNKDAFLAMLGHELRNPLAPIRNALHVLHRRGPDPATLTWAHEVTHRQVRYLTRLVDDLLDVSRISRAKIRLHCERLDLCEVVRGTVEDYRTDVDEAGLRLEVVAPDSPLWVLGDATRLAQVVGNLLGNAVKFTDPGGRITVRTARTDGGAAEFVVSDTGIGIEPDKLAHIFDSFSQEERSLDRNRGGLGLGLALVKGLVELHGGSVAAASPGAGQGTTVGFRLPLASGMAIPAEPVDSQPPKSKGLRILIIEDYRDVAETMQRFLEFTGHQVAIASSGPAGVAAAREFRPDVVLCDLGLPGMDGLAVARALRQDPETSRSRLIVMSGYGSENDQQRCLEAGYELHLTKPVDPDQLERILAQGS